MLASRKEPGRNLQLGDYVHYKGKGFGRVVKLGKFYAEVLLSTGRRLQTCISGPYPHRGGINQEIISAIDALPSKSVARNLDHGVVIDHAEHGLGRIIGRTGSMVTVRFVNRKSNVALALADSTGMIVDLFERSIGQCRDEIRNAQGRKPMLKVVSGIVTSPLPSTESRPEVSMTRPTPVTSPPAVPEVRADAIIETSIPSPAKQTRISGSRSTRPNQLPAVRERTLARDDARSTNINTPTHARPLETVRISSKGAKRLQPRSESAPNRENARTAKPSARKRPLIRCGICNTKLPTHDSVCANCNKELKKGFLGLLLPKYTIGPSRRIKGSLDSRIPAKGRQGTVQGGLPSLGKRR